MSAFQPYIDTSYPVYPAEEAAKPYEPGPVEAVSGAAPAQPVEPEEDRLSEDNDAVALSNAARELADSRLQETAQTQNRASTDNAALEAARIRNNLGIRELIQSFQNYNNSAALARYNNTLAMFVRYGSAAVSSGETDTVANLRAQENSAYQDLGIYYSDNVTRDNREGISQAIDRWFVGEGVFMPAMLHFTSSDGFRFTPMTGEARMALRAADVLASYERSRIAAYLREMAALTPEDFMFYDPTGLGSLGLEQRREFLARMDALLAEARIDARAAELTYAFNAENQLDLERLGLEEREEIARLDRLREEINTYYGMLRNSVRQYDADIISSSMS